MRNSSLKCRDVAVCIGESLLYVAVRSDMILLLQTTNRENATVKTCMSILYSIVSIKICHIYRSSRDIASNIFLVDREAGSLNTDYSGASSIYGLLIAGYLKE